MTAVEDEAVEMALGPDDDLSVGDRLVIRRGPEVVALLVVTSTFVDAATGDGAEVDVAATTRDLWPRPGDAVVREDPAAPFRVARVTFAARDLDVAAVFLQIAGQAGKDVDLDDDVPARRVTIALRDAPWDEAVLEVARRAGLRALVDPAGALITKRE